MSDNRKWAIVIEKNVIKKFAIEARRELLSRVSQRALKYGISEKELGNPNDDSVGGHLLSSTEKSQRAALIKQIQEKGYEQVMEEVAYTWFNRFSALRFMEVNGFLPTRVRVFTDENNAFKPQILTEAIHMELDGLDMEKVYAYKEANDDDALYKYLLITQCNALNSLLPGMFQRIADYTELLFPDNLFREGSVVQQMVTLIPEDDWKDAVQIIGWLYQYYNSEKKDDVFAALKKNVKITKENIPAATQLFTPDWIVRYMVENSLGRLWIEGHPNDDLKGQWKYYLEEAEQEPEVQAQLDAIREEYKALKPEGIRCIDPCSGSGHILAYMFDVLVQIYEAYGVDTRTAVKSIVENNLYGLDIDDRAAQLSYFAVMMKACQYDKRFLKRRDENGNPKIPQPKVFPILESGCVDKAGNTRFKFDKNVLDYFCNGDEHLREATDTIIKELFNAKEYGSIIKVSQQDWPALYARFDEIADDIDMSRDTALRELLPLVQVAEALAQKYDVVVTNPPYMGNSSMSAKLLEFIKKYYPDSKSDMFAIFIESCRMMTKHLGFQAMITQHAWMSLASYEKLRYKLHDMSIVNMAHLGARAFEEVSGEMVQTTSFVFQNVKIEKREGVYCRLVEPTTATGKEEAFLAGNNRYNAKQDSFERIPGAPVSAYVAGDTLAMLYEKGKTINDVGEVKIGMGTGNNDLFLKLWWEVNNLTIDYTMKDASLIDSESKKYYPYSKGGERKRWYGNQEYVVWYDEAGQNQMKQTSGHRENGGYDYYFHKGMTWTYSTMAAFGARIMPEGFVFDVNGSSLFLPEKYYNYVLCFLQSCVGRFIIDSTKSAFSIQAGTIRNLPVIGEINDEIENLANECIKISREDWDSFETSWDFKKHPFVTGNFVTIKEAYEKWQLVTNERNDSLNQKERRINEIFIDKYELANELSPDVNIEDGTLHVPDLNREVRSFISYAVGCMFGRYAPDKDGVVYAGGEWDASKYASFAADKDNIIPICDDEYFEDDIVGLFVEFVKTVYGAETLDENLKFIADALGGKGQPKDMIRNYFLSDFYSDHCKIYQKRPIYWLFDSGKKNGFKALIYMHRYQPDTIARIRTDYVHEQQARYRTAIADLEQRIANAATGERVKLNKQLKKLNDQAAEILAYEEKIHHLADQMIPIDLDDGVKVNYAKFQDVLAKIK